MGEDEDNGEDPLGGNAMMEEEEDEMESKRVLRKRFIRAPSMREDSPRIESDASPHSSPIRLSPSIHRSPLIRRSSPIPPSISTKSQKGRTQGSVGKLSFKDYLMTIMITRTIMLSFTPLQTQLISAHCFKSSLLLSRHLFNI